MREWMSVRECVSVCVRVCVYEGQSGVVSSQVPERKAY